MSRSGGGGAVKGCLANGSCHLAINRVSWEAGTKGEDAKEETAGRGAEEEVLPVDASELLGAQERDAGCGDFEIATCGEVWPSPSAGGSESDAVLDERGGGEGGCLRGGRGGGWGQGTGVLMNARQLIETINEQQCVGHPTALTPYGHVLAERRDGGGGGEGGVLVAACTGYRRKSETGAMSAKRKDETQTQRHNTRMHTCPMHTPALP